MEKLPAVNSITAGNCRGSPARPARPVQSCLSEVSLPAVTGAWYTDSPTRLVPRRESEPGPSRRLSHADRCADAHRHTWDVMEVLVVGEKCTLVLPVETL